MHRLRLSGLCCAVMLLVAGAVPPARATIVTYDSLAAWQAVTSSYQTTDFEVGAPTNYSTAAGYAPAGAGIQFVGQLSPSYFLWIVDSLTYNSGYALKGPWYDKNKPTRRIDVTLTPGVTAFALDLMTLLDGSSAAPPQDIQIVLSTGDIVPPIHTAMQPTSTFFGLTSTEPIDLVKIYLTSGGSNLTYALIDNVRYGAAASSDLSETPETGTYALVGMGLIGLSLVSKRRRRSGNR